MKLNNFIKTQISQISNVPLTDEQALEKAAEWVIPSVLFEIDKDLAAKMVLNEDVASSKGAPTGIDFISFDDNPIPTFVQVKTGGKALDFKKLLKDAMAVYEFFTGNTPKDIHETYKIDETLAQQIKSKLKINGYTVAFITSHSGKASSSNDVMVYNSKDITSAFHKNSMKFFQGYTRTKNFKLSNEKDSAILHSNNSAIDFHIKLGELVKMFDDDHFESSFEHNVRSEEGGSSKRVQTVKTSIQKTLKESPEKFINLNNGITIVVDSFSFQQLPEAHNYRIVQMRNPSIVNGQQTFRQIKLYKESASDEDWKAATVLVRLKEVKTKEEKNEISEATNKMIKVQDINLVASKVIFTELFDMLLGAGIFLEGKYKFKDYKGDDLSPLKLEVLFGVKVIQIKNIDNFSNIKTQIYTNFFNGDMPEIEEYFRNPDFEEISKILVIHNEFKKYISSGPLLIYYTSQFLKLAEHSRYKDASKYEERFLSIKDILISENDSFKSDGPRDTKNGSDLKDSWGQVFPKLEEKFPE